jgi:hypothetical protein
MKSSARRNMGAMGVTMLAWLAIHPKIDTVPQNANLALNNIWKK